MSDKKNSVWAKNTLNLLLTLSVQAGAMRRAQPNMTPDIWFRHLFSAKAALDGGVVRRKVRDMERIVGREAFQAELARRGFTAVENAGQVVVFCNCEPVQVVVSGTKSS